MRITLNVAGALALASAALSRTLTAQASDTVATPKLGGFEVAAQLSVIPLYSGDATVDGYAGTGIRLSLSRFWGGDLRGAFVEAAYTHTPDDEFQGKPRLDVAALSIGWRAAPQGRVAAQGTLGASRVRYELPESQPCPPLEGCIAEGGGNFQDAAVNTVVAGLGVVLSPARKAGLRFDGRIHWPVQPPSGARDERKPRVELAGGLRLRF